MTARLYPSGRAGLLDGSIDWTADEGIRAILLQTNFIYNPADTVLDDLNSVRILATSDPLENASFDSKLAAGDPFSFGAFTDARNAGHVVIYADSGDPVYSQLIAHYDADSLIGAPFSPAGFQYFAYPVVGLGGYFQITDDPLVGAINTHLLAAPYSLTQTQGGVSVELSDLFVGTRLDAASKVCMPPDEEFDCEGPTFRGLMT